MDLLTGLLVAVAVLIGAWLLVVALLWVHRPSRELALPVLRALPDIVRLVRGVLRDPTTPRSVKIGLGLLVVWLVSPIDLIPDFIPVLGSLDDVILAAIVLRWAARRIGTDRLHAHWTGSPEGWMLVQRLIGTS